MRETASGRRQAPLNVTSSLDAARELRIRDAHPRSAGQTAPRPQGFHATTPRAGAVRVTAAPVGCARPRGACACCAR